MSKKCQRTKLIRNLMYTQVGKSERHFVPTGLTKEQAKEKSIEILGPIVNPHLIPGTFHAIVKADVKAFHAKRKLEKMKNNIVICKHQKSANHKP